MTIDERVESISESKQAPTGYTLERIHLEAAKVPPAILKARMIVVGAFADGTLPPPSTAIDAVSKGRLSALIERGDRSGGARQAGAAN